MLEGRPLPQQCHSQTRHCSWEVPHQESRLEGSLLSPSWLVRPDSAVCTPHWGRSESIPGAKASTCLFLRPFKPEELKSDYLVPLWGEFAGAEERRLCISQKALLCCRITPAAWPPSPCAARCQCSRCSRHTWGGGNLSVGLWPQVFCFTGGSGINSAVPWWES